MSGQCHATLEKLPHHVEEKTHWLTRRYQAHEACVVHSKGGYNVRQASVMQHLRTFPPAC